MQPVVIAKPYQFVRPHQGALWPALLRPFMLRRYLGQGGVVRVECRGTERLRASLAAGHGIVLAPNHCRPCDPFVVAALGREAGCHLFIMASWHVFMQSRLQRFVLPRVGVFSVYREGSDREALTYSIRILTEAHRPLVVFPEGVISRHNDRVNPLMEGLGLIARAAARQRAASATASSSRRVVIHPVAIRYVFEGNAEDAVRPMLDDLERRMSWAPQRSVAVVDRILNVGLAFLARQEVAHFGAPQAGGFAARVPRLVDRMLTPIEDEWLVGRREGTVVQRVKLLRAAILPDLIAGTLDEMETRRRWTLLRDLYQAQQISLYPADYLAGVPPPERLIELAEKLEEDLTDTVRRVSPFRAIVDVGCAIDVAAHRSRGGGADAVVSAVREQIQTLLDASLAERMGPPTSRPRP